jgi:signal transduction histidine kinase
LSSARRRSFGQKLTSLVVITTGVAALVITTSIAAIELQRLRTTLLARFSTQATLIAIHSTAALRFADQAAGEETLAAMSAVPEATGAFLYDADGGLFATYQRAGHSLPPPAQPDPPGHRFAQRTVVLSAPIEHQSQRLGTLVLVYDLRAYYAAIVREIVFATVIGAAAIALALLLARRLRRGLEEPVSELARATRAVTQTRDYSIRAQKFDDDELGDLTDTLNQMLTRIEEYELRQREADEHRRRYTAELERRNRELDEFAYVASHDLRSPLQGIKHLARWIEEDNVGALQERSKRHIEQMQQRVTRLERLLDDLLQYSRAGRMRGEIVPVDTTALLRDTITLLAPPPGFTFALGERLPAFVTAKVPLETVFRNLINNAIKHHDRADGRIQVDCHENGAWYGFIVGDDGPGIPPEAHAQIFQMFETLKPRDSVEGSGMGLAIIKKIVESFGGSVGVDSVVGKGAKFRFTWPKVMPLEN